MSQQSARAAYWRSGAPDRGLTTTHTTHTAAALSDPSVGKL